MHCIRPCLWAQRAFQCWIPQRVGRRHSHVAQNNSDKMSDLMPRRSSTDIVMLYIYVDIQAPQRFLLLALWYTLTDTHTPFSIWLLAFRFEFHYLVVSWNRGTPKSSNVMRFYIINHQFGKYPFMEPPLCVCPCTRTSRNRESLFGTFIREVVSLNSSNSLVVNKQLSSSSTWDMACKLCANQILLPSALWIHMYV